VQCNLVHQIEDEEALLSVAAWPMLVELIIHNNPLTMENSGDPPLLQRFLGERLGIRIKRYHSSHIISPALLLLECFVLRFSFAIKLISFKKQFGIPSLTSCV